MKLSSYLFSLSVGWYEHIPSLYRWYEHSITKEVLASALPGHVAIIQDGNRRYAKKLGESGEKGHKYGADTTEKVLGWCEELGVRQLTLYSFSTENFKRPENEKKVLFDLFKKVFRESRENKRTHESKMRIRFLGDITMLPQDVRDEIVKTERATAGYDNFFLNLAIAYGGRQEIVSSARQIAREVRKGALSPQDITEDVVDKYLYFGNEPRSTVDLIIRTSGEGRTSNFLPWQASGNECAIYISAPYWPEFRKIDFLRAIRAYQIREKEHRIKMAVGMLKMRRQSGGIKIGELKESLLASFDISSDEADVILNNPLVKKELAKSMN